MLIPKSTQVEKSALDVGVLLGGILQAVLSKKSAMEIAGAELGQLIKVVEEAPEIGKDLAESKMGSLRGLVIGLTEQLEVAPAPAAVAHEATIDPAHVPVQDIVDGKPVHPA